MKTKSLQIIIINAIEIVAITTTTIKAEVY